MGGGSRVPYPKHVWSPAGGWYCQPSNWRGNTMIAGAVMFGVIAITWKFSAERENWIHRPEPGEWYLSRHWSRKLVEWDKEDKAAAEKKKQESLLG